MLQLLVRARNNELSEPDREEIVHGLLLGVYITCALPGPMLLILRYVCFYDLFLILDIAPNCTFDL